MNQNNPKKNLDISSSDIKKPEKPARPMTEQDAALAMGNFYETMGNCLLNLVAIQADMVKVLANIAQSVNDISTDTNDMAFYAKKTALSIEAVSIIDVEEQEKGEDDDEDDKKEPGVE